jgi:hypothetical protein
MLDGRLLTREQVSRDAESKASNQTVFAAHCEPPVNFLAGKKSTISARNQNKRLEK